MSANKKTNNVCTLAELLPGQRAVICGFDPILQQTEWQQYRPQLLALGLLPNTSLEMLRVAPLGDPLQIRIRGYHLSLRRREGQWIYVKRLDAPSSKEMQPPSGEN